MGRQYNNKTTLRGCVGRQYNNKPHYAGAWAGLLDPVLNCPEYAHAMHVAMVIPFWWCQWPEGRRQKGPGRGGGWGGGELGSLSGVRKLRRGEEEEEEEEEEGNRKE